MASKKVRVKKKAAPAASKKRARKKAPAKAAKKKRKARARDVDEISQLTSRLIRYVRKSGGTVLLSRDYGERALPIAREPGASTRPGDKKKTKKRDRA